MKRPNWFDWLIYKWFWRRWNPIFRENHRLRLFFISYMNEYEAIADKGWYDFKDEQVSPKVNR